MFRFAKRAVGGEKDRRPVGTDKTPMQREHVEDSSNESAVLRVRPN